MIRRLLRRLWGRPGALLTGLLALALMGPYAGKAAAATPSFFAAMGGPIGVAASGDRVFVTNYCGNPRVIKQFDGAGNSSTFATLPNRPGGGCYEDYLAISPGLGGFGANYIYVLQGPNIVQVSPDGATVSIFATIPGIPASHGGIAFDAVGTFGFDMIVTGAETGKVWRVTSAGVATLVATLTDFVEGPTVAPMSFAPYGGHILAAAEHAGRVWALAPNGTAQLVANVPTAESVHVIPETVCNFGSSGGAFFSAMYASNAVYKWPASDFAGLAGRVLVTREGGGIELLESTPGGIEQSLFQTSIGQHEGSAFVDCNVPPVCTINPSVGWKSPLHAVVPATLHNGAVLPIRFGYGSCSTPWIHDDSVIVLVTDTANPDLPITAYIDGFDIVINDVTHEYGVDFRSALYGLANGSILRVDVFVGGNHVGAAMVNVVP